MSLSLRFAGTFSLTKILSCGAGRGEEYFPNVYDSDVCRGIGVRTLLHRVATTVLCGLFCNPEPEMMESSVKVHCLMILSRIIFFSRSLGLMWATFHSPNPPENLSSTYICRERGDSSRNKTSHWDPPCVTGIGGGVGENAFQLVDFIHSIKTLHSTKLRKMCFASVH